MRACLALLLCAAGLCRAETARATQTARAVTVAEEAAPQFAGSAEFDQMIGNLFLEHGAAGPACLALRAADRIEPQRKEIALPLAAACLESRDLAAARAALAGIREK